MITINGHKFVKNHKAALDTLFQKDGTFTGFYKNLKGRVMFYDMQKKLFACAIDNGNFCGIVAARDYGGKPRYMFSYSEREKFLFGIPESYSAQSGHARAIIEQARSS